MTRTSGTIVVFVTCPTRPVAARIARAVVEQRLAACVNILPGVTSLYTWQGKVENAREILLMIKTVARRWESLRRAIHEMHPYDVPEIIAMPIATGHPPYLAWIRQSVLPSR